MGIGVHQGSVFGSLLFIIVLVASFLGSYTQAADECCRMTIVGSLEGL